MIWNSAARVAGLLVVLAGGMSRAHAAGPAEGYWLNADQDAVVLFAPCGDALCGTIAWLKEPFDQAGRPLIDTNNPDPQLTSRPICGLTIASGLRPLGAASLDGGAIYDPEEGKSYSAALDVLSDTTLKITGYVGVKLLGRSETWTRIASVPPACGAAPR